MKGRGTRLGWALWVAFFAGCGSDATVQGGGATETDNSIRIVATTETGAPLAHARVKLVRTDTWLRDVAASGRPLTLEKTTDAQGHLRLDSLPTGEWSAQVDTLSQAGNIPLTRDTITKVLKLQSLSTVAVTVTGKEKPVLLVVGTTWKATADSSGRSKLLLPPGRRSVVARIDTTLAQAAVISIPTVGRSLDTTVTLTPRRLVLDNFASGDGRTTLSSYTGHGVWFVNSWGTVISSDANPSGASFAGALSLKYVAPDTANAALAGIYLRTSRDSQAVNFSRMDSICFDARGNGWVDLYFIEYATDRSWNRSANRRLERLTTTWSRHCVDADSLQDQWPAVKKTANTIAFLAKRGDFLEVRAMELWGVRLEDLSR